MNARLAYGKGTWAWVNRSDFDTRPAILLAIGDFTVADKRIVMRKKDMKEAALLSWAVSPFPGPNIGAIVPVIGLRRYSSRTPSAGGAHLGSQ
jgi:hypothetical protein